MRVMTYNVKGLDIGVGALVEVIDDARPDVLALQEPPRGRHGHRRLAELAGLTGQRVVVGEGPSRTTALLVRQGVRVDGARGRALPWRLGQVPRGYCLARIGGVTVVDIHLPLGSRERLAHLDRVLHDMLTEPGPYVVMGDLNEQPGGPVWARLGSGLVDAVESAAPTFTARRPRRRLDAVLVSPGLRVTGSTIRSDDVTRRASDHLPIVVDLDVPLDA
ncbi:endonuclease/exonuclease/phosphatase family protein [uncultured Cellulomonas sp.]|uniref:endonuclease/exonuclease/phosphatase family protein n=1 Tax=uncultured Cellulomonas sp. TaxID=189682 RepID=UPI00260E6249|nr:endonuclease/exonuclease/phosphatase family protein [uncultured Cellulomonas sp.]